MIIEGMIAAIVTCKKFKEKRMKEPLTNWVTVSDETFLLLCLDNYAHVWRYEVRKAEGRLEDGEKRHKALFTGKGLGSKKSWDDRAMNVFNNTMKKVWTDRYEHGKKFDAHFLKYMEFVGNNTPVKGNRVGSEDEAGAQASTSPIILSDFNIESVMAQEYKEQNKPKKGSAGREEIMAGNLCDDDDNANDSDDDEIVYSDNNDNDDNDEMSSGTVKEV